MEFQNEFIRGYFLCVENAEQWMEEAAGVAKNGSFGHACAMLIHSLEAIAQAFICYYASRNLYTPDDTDFKKTFKDHKTKLQTILDMMVIREIVNGQLPEIADTSNQVEFWKKLVDRDFFMEQVLGESDKRKMKFIRRIMDTRNFGIYVDYNYETESFSTPLTYEKKEYIELKEIVDESYDQILNIVIWVERLIDIFGMKDLSRSFSLTLNEYTEWDIPE